MLTTLSSRAFAGWIPPTDVGVVARLRRAGFVVLGKTNTPELGLIPLTNSELNGICRNPWDTARTPGGSSGGAAAAVAAGLAPAAHGSDGGGSIRIPSSCCGLFGLKPSRGRISPAPYGGRLRALDERPDHADGRGRGGDARRDGRQRARRHVPVPAAGAAVRRGGRRRSRAAADRGHGAAAAAGAGRPGVRAGGARRGGAARRARPRRRGGDAAVGGRRPRRAVHAALADDPDAVRRRGGGADGAARPRLRGAGRARRRARSTSAPCCNCSSWRGRWSRSSRATTWC